MFLGNEAAARKLAKLDGDHYTIESIDKHTGDPLLRSSMRFLVTFADKEQIWKNWSTELFATVQYEDYIRQHRPLYPLLFTLEAFAALKAETNAKPIENVSPGDHFFLDLRLYGYAWYKTLNLPDDDDLTYVFDCVYTKFPQRHPPYTKIEYKCIILNELYDVQRLDIYMNNQCTTLTAKHVLLTAKILSEYPDILPSDKRKLLIKKYKSMIT